MKYYAMILAAFFAASSISPSAVAYHPYGDRDRDGIPNYRDRINSNGPNGDRDHDGIRNKNDRHNNNRDYGDKDHDGIANIRDDHDNRLDTPKNR
ncbi:MAG: hypothetical protein AB7I18_02800 [Candidatus Berkiella sp.]